MTVNRLIEKLQVIENKDLDIFIKHPDNGWYFAIEKINVPKDNNDECFIKLYDGNDIDVDAFIEEFLYDLEHLDE